MSAPALSNRLKGRSALITGASAGIGKACALALAAEGVIGRLHPVAYYFVGACAQTPLTKRIAPRWVEMWKAAGIDGAVLVPV